MEPLVDFIQHYEDQYDQPPTLREIKDQFPNLGYGSSVRYALQGLVTMGKIHEIKPEGHARRYSTRKSNEI